MNHQVPETLYSPGMAHKGSERMSSKCIRKRAALGRTKIFTCFEPRSLGHDFTGGFSSSFWNFGIFGDKIHVPTEWEDLVPVFSNLWKVQWLIMGSLTGIITHCDWDGYHLRTGNTWNQEYVLLGKNRFGPVTGIPSTIIYLLLQG